MSESMSELESERMNAINNYLFENETINSTAAANLLSVEVKTARRLLNKAVKMGMLKNDGKTKNRVYKRI